MSDPTEQPRPQSDQDHESDATQLRTILSEELLKGSREILIRHAGDVYRLRLTRNGKLILQK